MYSYFQQLEERVLYYDTHSLIYVVKEGEFELELVNYLGQLKDKLEGDSSEEFAAAGAKELCLSN